MFKHTEPGEADRTRLSMEQLNAREMLTAVPMDVDGDGLVTTADASAVIEVLVGGQIYVDGQADIDGNGNVSPLDALLILNDVSSNGGNGDVAANESSADVSFALIGDYGLAANARSLAIRVNLQSPDFVLGAGDARYGRASYEEVHGFFCDYISGATPGSNCMTGGNSAENRFFTAPGNHDYSDGEGISDFTDYFDFPGNGVVSPNPTQSELYYDVVQGPVHVFVLDSQAMLDDELSREAQLEWLQAGLASSQSVWQIVVLHHSPYSSAAVNGSNPLLQFPYADWGVDLVLSGHDHTYERIERDGTTFIVNGLGTFTYEFDSPIAGSKQRYNEVLGAAFFVASETELTGSFMNLDLEVIDSFVVTQTTGLAFDCDYVGNGDGCDISDLNALYARIEGVPTPLTNELVTEWLGYASSAVNPLKEEATDIYVVGDVDLNGDVDSDDLGLLLNSIGDTALGWSAGNFNMDAIVDSEDLGLLLNNFNFDSAVEATSASIGCAEPGNCCGGVCSGCALWAAAQPNL